MATSEEEFEIFMKNKDVRGLNNFLRERNDWVLIKRAAEALGDIGDKSSIPFLIDLLYGEELEFFEPAAEALVKFGTSAIEPLVNKVKW